MATRKATELASKPAFETATFRATEARQLFTLPHETHFFTAGQVHSDAVANCDDFEPAANEESQMMPDCDALISTRAGTVLAIRTADCLPILLFEPVQKIIAAVHAGWRGVENKITIKTIEKIKEIGGDPTKLLVWVGPAIGNCCFEVQGDVASKFTEVVIMRDGKTFVDLHAVLKKQLLHSGITKENIEWAERCTCCEQDVFVSHRREGTARTSVNWSVIAL